MTVLQAQALLLSKQQRQCASEDNTAAALVQLSVKESWVRLWAICLTLDLSAEAVAVGMNFDNVPCGGLSNRYPPVGFLCSALQSHFIMFSEWFCSQKLQSEMAFYCEELIP